MTTTLIRFLGNNARLTLPLTHPDTGAAFNPAGHVLLFTAKLHPSLPDTEAKIQKISTVGGITVSPGEALVDLVPADAAALKAGVAYYMDVLAQHSTSGACLTVFSGRLQLAAVVTQEPSLSIPTHTTNPGGVGGAGFPATMSTVTNKAQHQAVPTIGASLPWVVLIYPAGVWTSFTLRAKTGADDQNLIDYPADFYLPADYDAVTNNVLWYRSAFA